MAVVDERAADPLSRARPAASRPVRSWPWWTSASGAAAAARSAQPRTTSASAPASRGWSLRIAAAGVGRGGRTAGGSRPRPRSRRRRRAARRAPAAPSGRPGRPGSPDRSTSAASATGSGSRSSRSATTGERDADDLEPVALLAVADGRDGIRRSGDDRDAVTGLDEARGLPQDAGVRPAVVEDVHRDRGGPSVASPQPARRRSPRPHPTARVRRGGARSGGRGTGPGRNHAVELHRRPSGVEADDDHPAVASSTASTHSVRSRRTRQGTRSQAASRWIPPESVRTAAAWSWRRERRSIALRLDHPDRVRQARSLGCVERGPSSGVEGEDDRSVGSSRRRQAAAPTRRGRPALRFSARWTVAKR